MKKIYDPPLTTAPHAPLYRIDKAIIGAQKRLTAAIEGKRLHTSNSLAQEVVREAREALRKAEHQRALKMQELAQRAAQNKV